MTDDQWRGSATGSTPSGDFTVVDNRTTGRYEIAVGDEVAFLEYRRRKNVIALIHTEVPESLRGHGLAPLLARAALDAARVDGLRVIVLCPYVKTYIRRHPEYQALVTGAADAPVENSG